MHRVVCTTGLPGSGKSIVSDKFIKKGFLYIRLGQIIIEELKRLNMPPGEASERFLREDIRKQHGMAAMALLNLPKIEKLRKKGNVIVDGLYSFEEYKLFKEKFKKDFIVIAVFAPPALRYKRLENRHPKNGDTSMRNRPLTHLEAKTRDYSEIENLNKGGVIALADYTVLNTSSLSNTSKQVSKIIRQIMKE